jgi:hypothetical protein
MEDGRLLGLGLFGGSICLGFGGLGSLAAGGCLLAGWLGFGRCPEGLFRG